MSILFNRKLWMYFTLPQINHQSWVFAYFKHCYDDGRDFRNFHNMNNDWSFCFQLVLLILESTKNNENLKSPLGISYMCRRHFTELNLIKNIFQLLLVWKSLFCFYIVIETPVLIWNQLLEKHRASNWSHFKINSPYWLYQVKRFDQLKSFSLVKR